MIGGMLAATLLVIFLIPACYSSSNVSPRSAHRIPLARASAEHDGTRLRLDGQSRHGAEAA